MRPINADALKQWVDDSIQQYGNQYSNDMLNMFGMFKEVIDNAPTVEDRYAEGYSDGYLDGMSGADMRI